MAYMLLVHNGKGIGYFPNVTEAKNRAAEIAKQELGRVKRVEEKTEYDNDRKRIGQYDWTFIGEGFRVSSFWLDAW